MIMLKEDEKNYISCMLKDNKLSDRVFIRANCLLLLETNRINDTAEILKISTMTVRNIKKRYINKGIECLNDKKRKTYQSKGYTIGISTEKKEQIIALAKSKPPPDRKRWTLRLLKKIIIKNNIVQKISIETIRIILKKNNLNFGQTWFKKIN
jgi:transposase